MRSPRSLLLVTVDCFRADHAGFLGYARPTTPFLDSLARESVVFSNAIVAGAPTYFSFPSIMASRDPLSLGTGRNWSGASGTHHRIGFERSWLCHRRISGRESVSLATFWIRCGVRYFQGFSGYRSRSLSQRTLRTETPSRAA